MKSITIIRTPDKMSIRQRLQCLAWLKEIGYQTGTGIMVGSPGTEHRSSGGRSPFIEQFHPEMIGNRSFYSAPRYPVAACPPGSMEMTLKLLSIFRLMHPKVLLPSTTALANACTGWTRTRNTGRSQCSNAKPFSPGTTEQILTL